jgi:hypothetical protein
MAKDPQWGTGAARGRRIPDSEDKPVEKRDHKAGAETGAAIGLGAHLGQQVNAGIYRRGNLKVIGQLHGRGKVASRLAGMAAIDTAAGAGIGALVGRKSKPVSKAMTSSALSHMLPKAAGAMKPIAPESAKPVTTLGLKKTGGSLSSVAKARHFDPEARRQRRLGAAQAATLGGGAGLTLQGAKGVELGFNGKKLDHVRLPMNRKVAGRLGGGLALLGAGAQISRFANSTSGRGYR